MNEINKTLVAGSDEAKMKMCKLRAIKYALSKNAVKDSPEYLGFVNEYIAQYRKNFTTGKRD